MKKNFFSGTVRLCIAGLNLDRFLNSLIKNDIKIYNLAREEHKSMSFSVPYNDKNKVIELSEERQYNITEISSYGLFACMHWARRRIALLISLVAAIILICLINSFVWDVRISGLDTISYDEVQSALANAGVSGVCFKNNIDRGKLETEILASIPGVSYVNVYMKGLTLFVDIVEALPKETAKSKEPRDICAQADGVINRIVTISGTPTVKIGDKVTAGQVLISRYVTYPDGSTVEVRADGEVYAEVAYEAEAAFLGQPEDFEKSMDALKQKAAERAQALLPQGGCLIDTKYDIIDTITGKSVRCILLVERRIDF